MTSAREEEANWSALLTAKLEAMSDEELSAFCVNAYRLYRPHKRGRSALGDRLYTEAKYAAYECRQVRGKPEIWLAAVRQVEDEARKVKA